MVSLLPRLRAFAHALARNPADADDLVQQTCEKALAGLSGFVPGTRLESWMFRIMHNQWIDTIRKRGKGAEIGTDGLEETLMGEDGRRTNQARLELREVNAAMAALPPEQRSVLVLVCVEGLRYREVADILDIPIGTVMSRLARARTTISDALDGKTGSAITTGEQTR